MTHSDIIGLWPSIADFSRDLGVSYESAKAMRRRSSIPGHYWKTVVGAARLRGFTQITYEALVEAAAAPLKDKAVV